MHTTFARVRSLSFSLSLSVTFLLLIAFVFPLHSADVAGASDHPQVKRVTGSEIFFQSTADYDARKFALGKVEWDRAKYKVSPYQSTTVEGKRLTTYYKLPENILVLEAFRNYEQELRTSGFEILFAGQGDEVETIGFNNQIALEIYETKGSNSTPEEKAQWPFQYTDEAKAAYIAARKKGEAGELYVSVYLVTNKHNKWLQIPVGRTLVRVDVIETKEREQRMELVTSEKMASEITLNGRIALYGIQFDTDSAAIKPDSQSTLAEIAKFLQQESALKILVVGHTDTEGAFDYNRKLSQSRAESVVASLAAQGVAKERLFPVGVSFASPIATNQTGEGRAKNRRVELVDMASPK